MIWWIGGTNKYMRTRSRSLCEMGIVIKRGSVETKESTIFKRWTQEGLRLQSDALLPSEDAFIRKFISFVELDLYWLEMGFLRSGTVFSDFLWDNMDHVYV